LAAKTKTSRGGDRSTADRPRRPLPTDAEGLKEREARRGRNLRRIGIAGLVLIVGLGASGILGQRTSTVTAQGGGYRLTVTYPAVVRPGVDARFNVVVENPRGFGSSLNVAFSRHYFDIFDLNSVRPDADSSTSDGHSIVYTWDNPPGKKFEFALDLYAEFGEHLGLDGFTSVVDRDLPVVTVRYHTRWVP
jgi:pimeloyl-ACP methyl ester carboxylesterase